MTDVKHEAAARPRPSRTPARPSRTPSAAATTPHPIPNAVLNLVRNPASFITRESLTVDHRMPIELPATIATRLTGLEV